MQSVPRERRRRTQRKLICASTRFSHRSNTTLAGANARMHYLRSFAVTFPVGARDKFARQERLHLAGTGRVRIPIVYVYGIFIGWRSTRASKECDEQIPATL